MTPFPLALLLFGTTLWLGLYLLNRDLGSARLRFAGLGLVAYALGLAAIALSGAAPAATLAGNVVRWCWLCSFLPPILWTGAIISFLPEDLPLRTTLRSVWLYGLLPFTVVCYLFSASTSLLVDESSGIPRTWHSAVILAILFVFPSSLVLGLTWSKLPTAQPKRCFTLLMAMLLLLALSASLLFFSSSWPLRSGLLLLIDLDLLFQGVTLAALDAVEQGESLLPDLMRSFDFSFFTALFFAGQVALVMIFATGSTFPMQALLLALIATSIVAQIFFDQLGAQVDKVALARFPLLRQMRAELRTTATILPRANQELDLEALDEVEFVRLTRRALSTFGDLSRLTANPLTHLPIVEARLAQQGTKHDALGRAVALKAVLLESITRLKPPGQGDFGTSIEWRHYNALYFPYVVGLKPYSRRVQHVQGDEISKKALAWFCDTVPERTLHNWQAAATKLIARDLRR